MVHPLSCRIFWLLPMAAAVLFAPGGSYAGPTDWGAFQSRMRGRYELPPPNAFTFARVRYSTWSGSDMWRIDWPDSDINFSQRLSELTTLEVSRHPDGSIRHEIVDLHDAERLARFPILYLVEPGDLRFDRLEIENLREHLLKGGFLHVDDFWGEAEWANWEREIGRVFPPDEYPIEDLTLDHEIFNIVFRLEEIPQVPSIHTWRRTGQTFERWDAREPHVRGIHDAQGRLMVVMTHNSDLGDGWEREGENAEYFREFSARKAYPLGINIVVYAMTH